MRVKVLGSAAGGGFPQWNCNCSNCGRLRRGTLRGRPRSQAQVALTADGHSWHLLNASPDLRYQIEADPALHPAAGLRDSPLTSVILTCAEIDQVLGLALLREMQPFRIYASPSVRRILLEDNSIFHALHRTGRQVQWTDIIPGGTFELANVEGARSGICIRTVPLSGHYPGFLSPARLAGSSPDEAVLGLHITAGAASVAYLPGVARFEEAWLPWLDTVDVLFFDGTFWSGDELARVHPGARDAREMGHIPISGPCGSLALLASLRRPRKVFIHINNTNPILDEAGPEYRALREAGWKAAFDGMEFDL
jgi:pyrroloquinoline quinone biosynthesis protein B